MKTATTMEHPLGENLAIPEFKSHGRHAKRSEPSTEEMVITPPMETVAPPMDAIASPVDVASPTDYPKKRKRFHPFRFLIESILVVFGLSAIVVFFTLLGAVLLILSVMAPALLEFFGG